MCSEKGQTLMELVVVVGVSVIVVGALVFATIASLRNASFARNQAQATKLAQEGLERARTLRDRDEVINTNVESINKFSQLYSVDLSHTICNTTSGDAPCYFRFISSVFTQGTNADYEMIGSFKRQITIGDQTMTYDTEKIITVVVTWTDFSGSHESKLTTILRKL